MTEQERQNLWNSYFKTHDHDIKNQLIVEYAPLVKVVASKLSIYFDGSVEYDDLVSYGIFGLIDAIDKFDHTKEVKFETYAGLRIKGSILDQIRNMDWIPRDVRKKQRKVKTAKSTLIDRGILNPTSKEIAKELGITEDEYYSWEASFIPTMLDRIDEPIEGNDEATKAEFLKQYTYELPEDNAIKEDMKEKLHEAISSLSEVDRLIINMFYFENISMYEIAKVLGVTQSRVSQLHKRALVRIKMYLGKNAGILFL